MNYPGKLTLTDEEILDLLKNGTREELIKLAPKIGVFHKNYEFAQEVSLKLLDNEDETIRAFALTSLSFIAGRFDKLSVKRVDNILKKYKFKNIINIDRAITGIEDIQKYTGKLIKYSFRD